MALARSRRAGSSTFACGFHRFEALAGLAVVLLTAGSSLLIIYESLAAFGDARKLARPLLVVAAGIVGFAANEAIAQCKLPGERRRRRRLACERP